MLRSHARGKSGVPFVSKVHKLEQQAASSSRLLLEFRSRKASSRVPTYDQFTQERTTFERLNVWGRERERERMKQKGEIRASIRERGPPWLVSWASDEGLARELRDRAAPPRLSFFSFLCLRCCCCKRMICCRCLIFFLLFPTELLVIWQRFFLPCLLLL